MGVFMFMNGESAFAWNLERSFEQNISFTKSNDAERTTSTKRLNWEELGGLSTSHDALSCGVAQILLRLGAPHSTICTEMQENMRARLRELRACQGLSHAT